MQSIIIFGASGLLGSAASQAFSEANFNVLLVARNEEKLVNLKEQLLDNAHGSIEIISANVESPEQVEAVFSTAHDLFGQVEYVLNSTGQGVKGSILDVSINSAVEILNTNAIGTLNILKSSANWLKQYGGHVINIASVAAHTPMPMHSVYGMSKCAQTYLSKVAALEFSGKGIQINVISPGIIQSEPLDMWLNTEQGKKYSCNIPEHSITSAQTLSKLILNMMLIRELSLLVM